MGSRVRLFLFGILSVVVAGVMGAGDQDLASAGYWPQETANPPAAAAPTGSNAAQVILLEAGQAPHQVLRMKPVKGQTHRHEMSMQMKMASEANGQGMPGVDSPPMTFTMESTVTDVKENGDFDVTVVYTDAGLGDDSGPPEMVEALTDVMQSMIGIRFNSLVNSRGATEKTEIEMPDSVNPLVRQQISEMAKSLDQMTSPFPQEAIGLGGKWKLVSPMETGGIKLTQTTIFTVEAMTADTVTVSVAISQEAPAQDVDVPDAGGAKVRLESLTCQGTGRSQLNLQSVLADLVDIKIELELEMNVQSFGQEIDIIQTVENQMKIKAVPKSN